MKLSEFLRRTGNNISLFCQKVFGDNPEQYVEENDDSALLLATVTGNLSKADAAELVKAFRDADKSASNFTRVENLSIQLDSKESGYKGPANSGKSKVNVSVKVPPTAPRSRGGHDREERTR